VPLLRHQHFAARDHMADVKFTFHTIGIEKQVQSQNDDENTILGRCSACIVSIKSVSPIEVKSIEN
jgi:hypothetical protein